MLTPARMFALSSLCWFFGEVVPVTIADGDEKWYRPDVKADGTFHSAHSFFTHVDGHAGCGMPAHTTDGGFRGGSHSQHLSWQRVTAERIDKVPAAGMERYPWESCSASGLRYDRSHCVEMFGVERARQSEVNGTFTSEGRAMKAPE